MLKSAEKFGGFAVKSQSIQD